MAKVGTAIAIVLTLLAALVGMSSCARAGEISDAIRIVPQLELTDLHPVKVAFAPDDDALLLIVNINGRVDIFDVSNPGAPAKITEILANANDAAFASTRTKREKIGVVSGGDDGTVRLWTLDGKPAAEPFKGNNGWPGAAAK
jgi:WD40 repeat protein